LTIVSINCRMLMGSLVRCQLWCVGVAPASAAADSSWGKAAGEPRRLVCGFQSFNRRHTKPFPPAGRFGKRLPAGGGTYRR
jgi:hypothetical protein